MYRVLHAVGLWTLAGTMATAADKSGYSLANPVPPALLRDFSTDRPDQTESPYTVDAGHFQVELDVVNLTNDRDRSGGADWHTRTWSIAPLNLKVGLTNRVDLQLMMDPWVSTRAEDRRAGVTTRASGSGEVATRVKFNLWGNEGGATAFAVMPFVKWALPASAIRNGKTEGGLILALGSSLPRGWAAGVMTEIDFVSDGAGGRDTEWLNSITLSHDLTDRTGFYCEFAALTGDAPGFEWQGQIDVGLTHALGPNLQLDLGCNFGVTKSAPDYQPFFGLSRRF